MSGDEEAVIGHSEGMNVTIDRPLVEDVSACFVVGNDGVFPPDVEGSATEDEGVGLGEGIDPGRAARGLHGIADEGEAFRPISEHAMGSGVTGDGGAVGGIGFLEMVGAAFGPGVVPVAGTVDELVIVGEEGEGSSAAREATLEITIGEGEIERRNASLEGKEVVGGGEEGAFEGVPLGGTDGLGDDGGAGVGVEGGEVVVFPRDESEATPSFAIFNQNSRATGVA